MDNKKIVVIGNCQAFVFAEVLKALLKEYDVSFFNDIQVN